MTFDPQVCFFWEGSWPARHIEPMRRLYETELVYVSQGSYDLHIGERTYTLRPGAVVLIPPGAWHESRCNRRQRVMRHCIHFEWQPGPARPGWQLQSFLGQPFDEGVVSPVPAALASRLPLVTTVEAVPGVREILERALNGLRRNEDLGRYLLWPVLSALLAERAAQPPARANPRSDVAQAAMKVRYHIDMHYQEPQGYKIYTELTGLSSSHLCQAFKRLFGRTPNEYLTDLRLSQAYRILSEGSQGVEQVARNVGIHDPNYFARIFRQRFGVTPSAHRGRTGG